MRVIVLVRATKETEAGEMPSPEFRRKVADYNAQITRAGMMLGAEGLQPSSAGRRVVFEAATRRVIDGPFTDSKELVGGVWIWQVRSLEEAVEWLKRAPFENIEVEVRPVLDPEAFARPAAETPRTGV
jgi:hypothetical protein